MFHARIFLSAIFAICSAVAWAQDEPDAASTNGAPAAAAPSNATPANPPANKENFHLYLLMGQSNMVGRDTHGMDTQVDNPRILALDASGHWVVARNPLHHPPGRIPPGVGPGMSFANAMIKSETDPNVVIGLIPCAVGGTPLKRWEKKGDLYAKALEQARLAAQVGVIKGVLWHQGEADSTKQSTADSYQARLTQMFQDLRADLGQPDLPIVVGQLGPFLDMTKEPFADTVRAAIKAMPAALPHVGYADSAGFTDKGDHLHFNADSQKQFGERYAQAMEQLETSLAAH